MAGEELVSDSEKVQVVTNFLLHAPPGEFDEVFNDVRVLLNNDNLLTEGAASAFSQYNKDQLLPVKLGESEVQGIVTDHNDLGDGRFSDPRSKQSFKYDHLRKEATDLQPWTTDCEGAEGLRSAIETEIVGYVKNHYKHGVTAVFSKEAGKSFVVCIEDHQYSPKNFWNGRWRSQWTVNINGSKAEVLGVLKVQVHYYEEGNVQLVSSKEVKENISVGSDLETSKALVKLMKDSEEEYQSGISENYQTMSDTTFKALRRALPVTKTKVDWDKIANYSIGKALKNL